MKRRYFDDDRPRPRRDVRPIEARLLDRLREWERLRHEASELKTRRVVLALTNCDQRFGQVGCWRHVLYHDADNYDRPVYPNLGDRCPACQASYRAHELYVETSKKAGAALRSLRRLLKGERDALRDPTRLRAAG